VNQIFHTYFWTPNGQSVPLEVVAGYRNFRIKPFVEVEDVFVSKAVRSIQLKLRECIVIPPLDRVSTRFSVCFPDKVCSTTTDVPTPASPTVDAPKRKHDEDGDSNANEKRPKTDEDPVEEKQSSINDEADSDHTTEPLPEEDDNEEEEDN
jgi:hypothetical protein